MRPTDVLAELRKQPFIPLLFRLSNGREYTVDHPDLVFVGRSALFIGTPASDLPPGVFDQCETVSLLHVAQIVPRPTVAQTTNGPVG